MVWIQTHLSSLPTTSGQGADTTRAAVSHADCPEDSSSPKGLHDHSSRLRIHTYRNKVFESPLVSNHKLFSQYKKPPNCFDRWPTIWHISNSEWQLGFLQTRQEFGFERHLWKLKSFIRIMHKVFPSALKTGMMQLSERSQTGIFQKPQNMLNIKIVVSVPIWLHSVGMARTNYCVNEVHSLNSTDISVNTIEQWTEKHWQKSLCDGFLQQPVKTIKARGHPKASVRYF